MFCLINIKPQWDVCQRKTTIAKGAACVHETEKLPFCDWISRFMVFSSVMNAGFPEWLRLEVARETFERERERAQFCDITNIPKSISFTSPTTLAWRL